MVKYQSDLNIVSCRAVGKTCDRTGSSNHVARVLTAMDALSRDRLGQRPYHEHTGDNICPSMVRGIDYMRDPRLNKVYTQLGSFWMKVTSGFFKRYR